jgi:hypothetical protein
LWMRLSQDLSFNVLVFRLWKEPWRIKNSIWLKSYSKWVSLEKIEIETLIFCRWWSREIIDPIPPDKSPSMIRTLSPVWKLVKFWIGDWSLYLLNKPLFKSDANSKKKPCSL